MPSAVAHEDPSDQITEVSRQIAQQPTNAALYLRRAELHRDRREWALGLEDLQTAQRLDPKMTPVDLALAYLLLDAGNAEPALVAIDRYLVAEPEQPNAVLLRARVLTSLGRNREAIAEFSRGIALADGKGRGPQPGDYITRAKLQACSGGDGIGDAIRGLDQGSAGPGGALTLQLLAVDLELSNSQWDSALERLAALEARANRKEIWRARRGDALMLAGRYEEARESYRRALAAIDALPPQTRSTGATAALANRLRAALAETTAPPGTPTRTAGPATWDPSTCPVSVPPAQ